MLFIWSVHYFDNLGLILYVVGYFGAVTLITTADVNRRSKGDVCRKFRLNTDTVVLSCVRQDNSFQG